VVGSFPDGQSALMLAVLLASTVGAGLYWVIARGFNFRIPKQMIDHFAGLTGDD